MNILNTIADRLRPLVEESKRRTPAAELEARIRDLPPARDFSGRLKRPGLNVIAELKKASPSKGLIRPDFRPAELARELEQAGAACLSVLTEPHYFLGGLDILETVRCEVEIPLLRKDFIFDPYQVLEARVAGADAVLLIKALLEDAEFDRLQHCADENGLAVLCEVHDQAELEFAIAADAEIIGVNSRDLKTFQLDRQEMVRLIGRIPCGRVAVAESGMGRPDDLAELRAAGARAFLIGESLMRAASPGARLAELLS